MNRLKEPGKARESTSLAKATTALAKLKANEPIATFQVGLKPQEVKTKLRELSGRKIQTRVWGFRLPYKLSSRPGIGGIELDVQKLNGEPEYGWHITTEPREYGTEIRIQASATFLRQHPWKRFAKHTILYALYGWALGFLSNYGFVWSAILGLAAIAIHTANALRGVINVSKRELPPMVHRLFAEHLIIEPEASPSRR